MGQSYNSSAFYNSPSLVYDPSNDGIVDSIVGNVGTAGAGECCCQPPPPPPPPPPGTGTGSGEVRELCTCPGYTGTGQFVVPTDLFCTMKFVRSFYSGSGTALADPPCAPEDSPDPPGCQLGPDRLCTGFDSLSFPMTYGELVIPPGQGNPVTAWFGQIATSGHAFYPANCGQCFSDKDYDFLICLGLYLWINDPIAGAACGFDAMLTIGIGDPSTNICDARYNGSNGVRSFLDKIPESCIPFLIKFCFHLIGIGFCIDPCDCTYWQNNPPTDPCGPFAPQRNTPEVLFTITE